MRTVGPYCWEWSVSLHRHSFSCLYSPFVEVELNEIPNVCWLLSHQSPFFFIFIQLRLGPSHYKPLWNILLPLYPPPFVSLKRFLHLLLPFTASSVPYLLAHSLAQPKDSLPHLFVCACVSACACVDVNSSLLIIFAFVKPSTTAAICSGWVRIPWICYLFLSDSFFQTDFLKRYWFHLSNCFYSQTLKEHNVLNTVYVVLKNFRQH